MTALFCIFFGAVQYCDLQVILFVIIYFLLIDIRTDLEHIHRVPWCSQAVWSKWSSLGICFSSTSSSPSPELGVPAIIKDTFGLAMLLAKSVMSFGRCTLNFCLRYCWVLQNGVENQCKTNLQHFLHSLVFIFMLFKVLLIIRWHCFLSLLFTSKSENLTAEIEISSSNGGFSVFTVR